MNENNLKTIHIFAFAHTTELRKVLLRNNELESPMGSGTERYSPFFNCWVLEFLDLSHNKVSNILDDWKEMPNLKMLDLSYNQLQGLWVIIGS